MPTSGHVIYDVTSGTRLLLAQNPHFLQTQRNKRIRMLYILFFSNHLFSQNNIKVLGWSGIHVVKANVIHCACCYFDTIQEIIITGMQKERVVWRHTRNNNPRDAAKVGFGVIAMFLFNMMHHVLLFSLIHHVLI